jgi:hypothetical protein
MPNIKVMAFYFGRLPSYFPLTLKTMGCNTSAHWTIFTDSPVPELPANVSVRHSTFSDFCTTIQRRFPFDLAIPRPYKLADLRPAFGDLFPAEIDGYEVWGCCDLDVLFGQTANFLTYDVAANYDKFLLRGAFSLYRNDPVVNTWYSIRDYGADYVEAFQDPTIRYFDEWKGINKIASGLNAKIWDRTDATFDISVHHYIPRANYSHTIRPRFMWEAGALREESSNGERREGIYLH